MSKTKTIKPLEDYGRMADGEVVSRGTAVNNGLTGNLNFTNLPGRPGGLQVRHRSQ